MKIWLPLDFYGKTRALKNNTKRSCIMPRKLTFHVFCILNKIWEESVIWSFRLSNFGLHLHTGCGRSSCIPIVKAIKKVCTTFAIFPCANTCKLYNLRTCPMKSSWKCWATWRKPVTWFVVDTFKKEFVEFVTMKRYRKLSFSFTKLYLLISWIWLWTTVAKISDFILSR